YTARMPVRKNLAASEIADQVLRAVEVLGEGERIGNLVYMGMGEPLHNFDGVVGSFAPITDAAGLGYSPRKVTVSTSGLVPQIERLGRTAPVNLAISLNASSDEVRDRIMPINRKYPIATLMDALRRYPLPPRRKMTIEYVLLGTVNDTDADAHRLVKLLRGLPVRVNLIPWNPFQGPGFARPADERVRSFQDILQRRGLTVTVRTTKGIDIDAACGQLGERPTAAEPRGGGGEA
ncbi:MAG: radical SAM protein, partial [Myxococcales bacterium]|nr:radical SAM protein [Myxococcales bacterium]